MTARRTVRVTEAFFDQLDTYFGPDRGVRGEPSATDFIVLELPAIVERFAIGFDELPEIVEGVPVGRMLITSGVLVRAVAVFGLASSVAAIDLIGITVDT